MVNMITWDISNTERQSNDGLIVTVHWTATAVDGEHIANAYGSVGLQRGDSFTPFTSVTKEQLISWAKSALGDKAVTACETALIAQIAAAKNPVKLTGLPWAESTP
jgi:hypothetical protein